MCEYFLLIMKVFKRNFAKRDCKIKVQFHFHQNKTLIYAEHFSACLCEFFKDRCLVYFCSGCYKISQFVFSTYYSRMYLKSVLSLV